MILLLFLLPIIAMAGAVVEDVRGIALIGDPSAARGSRNTCGIAAYGLKVPGAEEGLKVALDSYLGKDVDSDQISAAIEKYYAKEGYPFVAVKVPSSQTTPNVLTVLVLESRVGEVTIQENERIATSQIANKFRLAAGDLLSETTLLEDLQSINRIPFHSTSASFSPGKSPGTTDILLTTVARPFIRAFTGVDDTGTEPLGPNRWFAGFNCSNMFGLDQMLSVQYTGSTHLDRFKAITVQYTAPLSWRHTLFVYGGISQVKAPVAGTSLGSHGKSAQGSLRYQIPLKPFQGFLHEFSLGGDYKFTNNFLQFEEGLIVAPTAFVNILQFVSGYNLNYQTHSMNLAFENELFFSPGQTISHQTRTEYNTFRAGAKPLYAYWRGSCSGLWKGPLEFSAFLSLRGQLASANLLPSEQLGIGGYDSVRGYEERTLNMDNGFLGNLELRTPLLHFLKGFRNLKSQCYFLAFLDYGVGIDHTAAGQHPAHGWLLGTGPGMRVNIDRYFSARVDLGIRLHQRVIFDGRSPRVHFSFIGSF